MYIRTTDSLQSRNPFCYTQVYYINETIPYPLLGYMYIIMTLVEAVIHDPLSRATKFLPHFRCYGLSIHTIGINKDTLLAILRFYRIYDRVVSRI